jgi:hypothetical protein
VELKSRKVRAEVLRKKKNKQVSNAVIYPKEDGMIFINEQVAPKIGYLKYKAKQMAHRHGWKFVWVRNGKLFARKTENSAVLKIILEEDLEGIK